MVFNVKSIIEAALFVAGNNGVEANVLKKITRLSENDFQAIMAEMMYEYENDYHRGIVIKQVNQTYKFFTKAKIGKVIAKYFGIKKSIKLSQKMLETLVIIAYNEPCTKSKINELKGDPNETLAYLIKLELVQQTGRSTTQGKPYLYQVGAKFYDLFGINSLKDLPQIKIPNESIKTNEETEVDFFKIKSNNKE